MAHANIYQVSLFPLTEAETMCEETIFSTNDWFIGNVADYIAETDREYALQSLKQFAQGFSIRQDEHGEYILVHSKEDYFRPAWQHFCETMESTVPLDKFMSYRPADDRTGDWIYADGEMIPFPEFIRCCVVGEPYYIGGVLDYKS